MSYKHFFTVIYTDKYQFEKHLLISSLDIEQ